MYIYVQVSFTLTLDGGEWSSSRHRRFTLGGGGISVPIAQEALWVPYRYGQRGDQKYIDSTRLELRPRSHPAHSQATESVIPAHDKYTNESISAKKDQCRYYGRTRHGFDKHTLNRSCSCRRVYMAQNVLDWRQTWKFTAEVKGQRCWICRGYVLHVNITSPGLILPAIKSQDKSMRNTNL
jgi:hypothetical protein